MRLGTLKRNLHNANVTTQQWLIASWKLYKLLLCFFLFIFYISQRVILSKKSHDQSCFTVPCVSGQSMNSPEPTAALSAGEVEMWNDLYFLYACVSLVKVCAPQMPVVMSRREITSVQDAATEQQQSISCVGPLGICHYHIPNCAANTFASTCPVFCR